MVKSFAYPQQPYQLFLCTFYWHQVSKGDLLPKTFIKSNCCQNLIVFERVSFIDTFTCPEIYFKKKMHIFLYEKLFSKNRCFCFIPKMKVFFKIIDIDAHIDKINYLNVTCKLAQQFLCLVIIYLTLLVSLINIRFIRI